MLFVLMVKVLVVAVGGSNPVAYFVSFLLTHLVIWITSSSTAALYLWESCAALVDSVLSQAVSCLLLSGILGVSLS